MSLEDRIRATAKVTEDKLQAKVMGAAGDLRDKVQGAAGAIGDANQGREGGLSPPFPVGGSDGSGQVPACFPGPAWLLQRRDGHKPPCAYGHL